MSLFTDTMTVYNCTINQEGDTIWIRSVIKGVQWRHGKAKRTTEKGVQTETKVESVTVDFMRDYGNRQYTEPEIYEKLADKSGYWTLNARDGQDVLICGVCRQEINETYRISNLRRDYPHCVTVKSVADNRNRRHLRNIKLTAE